MSAGHDGETNIGLPFRMEAPAEPVDVEKVVYQQEFELEESGMVELKFPVPTAGRIRMTMEWTPPELPDYLPGDDE